MRNLAKIQMSPKRFRPPPPFKNFYLLLKNWSFMFYVFHEICRVWRVDVLVHSVKVSNQRAFFLNFVYHSASKTKVLGSLYLTPQLYFFTGRWLGQDFFFFSETLTFSKTLTLVKETWRVWKLRTKYNVVFQYRAAAILFLLFVQRSALKLFFVLNLEYTK